nr:hypothetical protein B0A51_07595 [Rachicladosporium sp. CCFEE 5018]
MEHYDAVIVGAGFAGIYQLYLLRAQGLKCLVIDQAGDVGGTWYWNLYPGAMSDTESYVYRYSWDKELLKTYEWKEHYVKQPQVLAYLEHVVERHDLRKDMRFNTQLVGANWDDDSQTWKLDVSSGKGKIECRYLVTGLGLLSKQNYPEIDGLDSFQGQLHHTAKWPKDLDLTGLRVGVVGCGSTGVQVITDIAGKVSHLTCFQRHPQYSVPSGDKVVTDEYRKWVNENYDTIWDGVWNSITAFGFKESERAFSDASPEEREKVFQENWDKGNGFRFMFGTFNDLTFNPEANEAACDFIRKKIGQIVKDPEKAKKLKPTDVYARRPLCDGQARGGAYYEQFNRENVDIVDLKETPIERVEAKGVRTSDGKLHELDVLVFATGFDAVEGNYTRINIHGRDGVSLAEAWDEPGPTSYLGFTMPGFPNFFAITGPKGPFTNIPPAVETQVRFINNLIGAAESSSEDKPKAIEATPEAEKDWSKLCEELAANSLFWKAEDNWIFGANIAGKRRCLRFFFGGMQGYRQQLEKCEKNGYAGFKPFADGNSSARAVKL